LGSLDGGSVRRKATTYKRQHNTEKRVHTSIPRAGFEPTIPVFERLKTVRALDLMAIIIFKNSAFFGDPLPHGILGHHITWRYFHSHLRSLYDRHVVISHVI